MKGVGKKLQRMVDAFVGPAGGNITEAARIAGYSFPEKVGHRVYKHNKEMFDRAEEEWRASLVMDARELDERITSLARNPAHRDHFKALELLARMQGRLDPRITVNIERKDVFVQLDEVLAVMVARRQAQLAESNGDVIDVPAVAS